jgi:hypothetical protein
VTAGVRWGWLVLSPEELREGTCLDCDDCLELSGGSRRPTDAADRIRAGLQQNGVGDDAILATAGRVRAGEVFPPLIHVSAQEHESSSSSKDTSASPRTPSRRTPSRLSWARFQDDPQRSPAGPLPSGRWAPRTGRAGQHGTKMPKSVAGSRSGRTTPSGPSASIT